jgi:hypothetical protein
MPEVWGVNGFVQLGSGEPIVMGFRIPGLLGQLNHLDILSERAGGKLTLSEMSQRSYNISQSKKIEKLSPNISNADFVCYILVSLSLYVKKRKQVWAASLLNQPPQVDLLFPAIPVMVRVNKLFHCREQCRGRSSAKILWIGDVTYSHSPEGGPVALLLQIAAV